MPASVNLPLAGRDVRPDLFRGLANWAIFLDHIPHEVLSWTTLKHYGFSDTADPVDSPILQWRSLAPPIKCGRNSLQVSCTGIVLSFCAHAAIELSLNSLWVQIFVGTAGILFLTASAVILTWSGQQDRVVLFPGHWWPVWK
jgi:hypothetical protein